MCDLHLSGGLSLAEREADELRMEGKAASTAAWRNNVSTGLPDTGAVTPRASTSPDFRQGGVR